MPATPSNRRNRLSRRAACYSFCGAHRCLRSTGAGGVGRRPRESGEQRRHRCAARGAQGHVYIRVTSVSNRVHHSLIDCSTFRLVRFGGQLPQRLHLRGAALRARCGTPAAGSRSPGARETVLHTRRVWTTVGLCQNTTQPLRGHEMVQEPSVFSGWATHGSTEPMRRGFHSFLAAAE